LGGSENENVGCFLWDPKNEVFIIGGNTTSSDFGPATFQHGFLVAIDMDSNWKWGNYYYNVSQPVTDITGCKLASDGNSLVVMGIGNQQPLYMNVNTKDGTINKFVSMEWTAGDVTEVPLYYT
jgi:hypothetical protein